MGPSVIGNGSHLSHLCNPSPSEHGGTCNFLLTSRIRQRCWDAVTCSGDFCLASRLPQLPFWLGLIVEASFHVAGRTTGGF